MREMLKYFLISLLIFLNFRVIIATMQKKNFFLKGSKSCAYSSDQILHFLKTIEPFVKKFEIRYTYTHSTFVIHGKSGRKF